jgi:hypothetical protein
MGRQKKSAGTHKTTKIPQQEDCYLQGELVCFHEHNGLKKHCTIMGQLPDHTRTISIKLTNADPAIGHHGSASPQ